jgi:hypothetical protein
MRGFSSKLLAASALAATLCSSLAAADPYHHWHGDMHHLRTYDYPHWREGRWYHGDHGGRFGWWWIAADMWYFYPAPVYPYPNPYVPPAAVVQPPPTPAVTAPPREQPVWYYCKSSRNYYPYVSVCPEGWRTVSAEPNDADER